MPKSKSDKKLSIYADGGARGNPGPAGIGAVIKDEKGKVVGEVSRFIGVATNNVAEYMAVIFGLQEALRQKASKVVVNVDSQLVARQLNGEYRVKDDSIKKFFDIALNLCKCFEKVEVLEIPREKNLEADKLVNKAINLESLL